MARAADDRNLIVLGQDSSRIWCSPFRRDRRELLPLFKLADDSEQQILSYLYLGEVLFAAHSGQAVGHVLIVKHQEQHTLELKSIAVLQSRQGEGVGGMLIRAALRYCHTQAAKRLRVSTAIADARAIGFYLHHGFRPLAIIRDAFIGERGYPDFVGDSRIPVKDAVEFELVLTNISALRLSNS